jgi:hypothetical protein
MFQPKHHWHPAEQQRHAVAGMRSYGQCHRDGEAIDTLCERTVSATERTELSRPWPTCLRAVRRRDGIAS